MKCRIRKKIGGVIMFMFLLMSSFSVKCAELTIDMESEIEETSETEEEKETEITTELEQIRVVELDLGDYINKMVVGEKQLLSVTILPVEASDTKINYISSDNTVATINGMGRITALIPGRTTITVSAGEVSQSFELQVVEETDTMVKVTDIEIGEYENELEVDKTMTISGTVIPSNATDTTIKYTSSNPAVATVSSSGEVKGISPGEVTITLSAGEIYKNVQLAVKIATIEIELNDDYLVLKTGETYQLAATVKPLEATQNITYRSVDSKIATVSQNGFVTAKETGSTTIIVSNGDASVAVSVIVNEEINYQITEDDLEQAYIEDKVYEDCVLASEQRIIDSQMLYYFYETGKTLKIVGDGYIIEIEGKNIINYYNEFCTNILLTREGDIVSFVLNEGKELCGQVTLYLEDTNGKYLYLYNTPKDKYQRINTTNINELKLTTAGKYQIRTTKIKSDMNVALYIVVGGLMILLIVGVIFIVVKRKYWFW